METNLVLRHSLTGRGDLWTVLVEKHGLQNQVAEFVDRPFALAGMAAAIKAMTAFFMADNLTIETADHTAVARLASVGIAPLKSRPASLIVRIGQHLDAGRQRDACALFCGIDDDDVFETVAAAFPALRNYDAKGNYVGAVANENGWTA